MLFLTFLLQREGKKLFALCFILGDVIETTGKIIARSQVSTHVEVSDPLGKYIFVFMTENCHLANYLVAFKHVLLSPCPPSFVYKTTFSFYLV